MTVVERYTSQCTLGASRVHRWWLACFLLALGDTEDWNNVSGHWYNEWPLNTGVDSPIFRWLGDTFLPMLVNAPAEYPKPDEGEASHEALLDESQRNRSALPRAPPPQTVVLFCPLPGQVHHLMQGRTKCFADH